ncbi:hypothetical protein D9598_20045 [Roseomonas sp. KE0001]|nr:hypothetical protein [Roseomonas sp. KE0001]
MICRQNPLLEISSPPRVLVVDEWAWRRGRWYGEHSRLSGADRVLHLLPDRQAETLRDWLRRHLGITVVTRDRACAYAEGARQARPLRCRSPTNGTCCATSARPSRRWWSAIMLSSGGSAKS